MTRTNKAALDYHKNGIPGKIAICPTKPLMTQDDLALAYSPGVAAPVKEIAANPSKIYDYTAKGNTVAVVTNGTAILGLGDLGPAASKPVMEGKAVLFKRFANIDAFSLEVDTKDVEQFINCIKYLGHSFGGINLEDIKAPDCFLIEKALQEAMDIPVFHDDQHGTAIVAMAALINACDITQRDIAKCKIVVNGAGAAAIACCKLFSSFGINKSNIILCDTKGVVYVGRTEGMNEWKSEFANTTSSRTLEQAIDGADVFLGLSVKDALTPRMLQKMANNPIIFALANPDPEISPEVAQQVRPDAIIATGRSDYPNQINNVMGFPYIFRGALDVRASEINLEMKIAAVKEIAKIARMEVPHEVSRVYSKNGNTLQYGPKYIIPTPFDPRLINFVPVAVAQAAVESGVARIDDFDIKSYRMSLRNQLSSGAGYCSFFFGAKKNDSRRVVFAEGEADEAIKAATMLRDNDHGMPILVGRKQKVVEIASRLNIDNLDGIEIVNASTVSHIDRYIDLVYKKLQRSGFLLRDCARLVKRDRDVFAACLVNSGLADVMITGSTKKYIETLTHALYAIDHDETIFNYYILSNARYNLLLVDSGQFECVPEIDQEEFLVSLSSSAAKIYHKMYGEQSSIAFIDENSFCQSKHNLATHKAIKRIWEMDSLKCDGTMTPEVALNNDLIRSIYPFSKIDNTANILIFPPGVLAITINLIQSLDDRTSIIGPMLGGVNGRVQIATVGSSANDMLNILLASDL